MVTITNSTIIGNTATSELGGGGIFNQLVGGAPTLNLVQVTVAGNQAPVGATIRRTSGTVNARAVIAANPLGSTNCNGTITSQGFNLEFPGTSCGFEVQADPQLGPLANNGGPTMTQALPSTSPAVDAVTAGCPPPPNDQRGVTRPQDGNPGGAVACDIGAFERSLGTLQFSSATYTVGEGGGTATITVTRTGGADDTVGATVTLGGGTATAGAD